jgi:hypothetical protein
LDNGLLNLRFRRAGDEELRDGYLLTVIERFLLNKILLNY